MRRYALFNEKRGFFVFVDEKDHYSKDINKARLFDKAGAIAFKEVADKIVKVTVDIRLA